MLEEKVFRATVSYRERSLQQQFHINIPALKLQSPHQKALNQTLRLVNTYNSLVSTPKISSRKSTNKIQIVPLIKQKIRVYKKSSRQTFRQLNEKSNSSNTSLQNIHKERHQNSAHKINLQQFFMMLSFMYNKYHRKAYKLQVFIDELIAYMKVHKENQLIREVLCINDLSNTIKKYLVNNQQGQFKFSISKNCSGELSKIFFYICYELYLYKTNKQNYLILSNIHKDMEYCARRIKMLNLTLCCCMNMGKINCDYNQFNKTQQEYEKALQLSIFLGDKHMEELAIDKLGICEYYRGNIVSANHLHNSCDKLTPYEKTKIKQNYSNQKQIMKILQSKSQLKTPKIEDQQQVQEDKQNYRLNFNGRSKNSEFVQMNYQNFKKELKKIIKVKDLRKKVPIIKSLMDKNSKIGDKRYCGNGYYVPKASKFHNKDKEQRSQECLISHRGYNRMNIASQTLKIDKQIRIIDQILNFCTNQFANSKYNSIQQVRESLYREQNQ